MAAQEKPESPYNTESEMKFVKSFNTSWFIHPEIDQANDANNTFIGSGPIDIDLNDSCSDIHFMPSDYLASLTGFETPDSDDEASNSITKEHSADNLNATSDGDVTLPNVFIEKENSDEIISGMKDSEDEPSAKKLKFTDQLFGITSSSFAPSPPREPTPPRDPSKGKGVATEEPIKELIPFIEEGGSDRKMINVKSFVTPKGVLSQEDFMAQLKEMKRLADLKAEKE
ncbi:hypothetical protein Tco_0666686 [Tanacetum coccineum]